MLKTDFGLLVMYVNIPGTNYKCSIPLEAKKWTKEKRATGVDKKTDFNERHRIQKVRFEIIGNIDRNPNTMKKVFYPMTTEEVKWGVLKSFSFNKILKHFTMWCHTLKSFLFHIQLQCMEFYLDFYTFTKAYYFLAIIHSFLMSVVFCHNNFGLQYNLVGIHSRLEIKESYLVVHLTKTLARVNDKRLS